MFVYKVTSPSNKLYIGCTTHSLYDRKRSHKCKSKNPVTPFHRAIKKYGMEKMIWEIVYIAKNKEDMLKKEILLISELKKTHILYNVTNGGEGTYGSKHNLGKKRTEAQCLASKKRQIIENGIPCVVRDLVSNKIWHFPSLSTVADNFNLNYSIVKTKARTFGTYKNLLICHKNNICEDFFTRKKPKNKSTSICIENKHSKESYFFKTLKEMSIYLGYKPHSSLTVTRFSTFKKDWNVLWME